MESTVSLIDNLAHLLDEAKLSYRRAEDNAARLELGLEVADSTYQLQASEDDQTLLLAVPDLIGEPTPAEDQAAIYGVLLSMNAVPSSARLALADNNVIFAMAVLPMPTGFSEEIFYQGLGDLMDLITRVHEGN